MFYLFLKKLKRKFILNICLLIVTAKGAVLKAVQMKCKDSGDTK